MPEEPRDEELGHLDDALFGDGSAIPPPPPAPLPPSGPSGELDWLDDGVVQGVPQLSPLSPEEDEALFFGPRGDLEPIGTPVPATEADPDAEGPIVDAAIFGTAAGAAGAGPPPTRRELHARPVPHERRKRVVVAFVVTGLLLLVGAGVVGFASGDDSGKQTQVKVVGTDLPSTTVTTRPATTAPATVAPTVVPTEPPTTARPATAANTTPPRTNPPVQATDPPVVATDPPPPPPTEATTTTTTTTLPSCQVNPNLCHT